MLILRYLYVADIKVVVSCEEIENRSNFRYSITCKLNSFSESAETDVSTRYRK